jgi:hypothetical protein
MEQLSRGSAGRRSAILIFLVEALPFHDRRTSAGAVFVDIHITAASREAIVLLEAEVLVIVTTTAAATRDAATSTAAASSSSSSPHAFEFLAIPSFTTTTTSTWRWGSIFKAVQMACRGAVR